MPYSLTPNIAQSDQAGGAAHSGHTNQQQLSSPLFATSNFDYATGFGAGQQLSTDAFDLASLGHLDAHLDPNFVPESALNWGTLPFDPDVVGLLDPSNFTLPDSMEGDQPSESSDPIQPVQQQNPPDSRGQSGQSGQSDHPQYHHHQRQPHRR